MNKLKLYLVIPLSCLFLCGVGQGAFTQIHICGVELTTNYYDGQTSFLLCNYSDTEFDLSGFYVSVSRRKLDTLTDKIPPNTVVEARGRIRITVTFLDFPFKKNGKERFKKYFLFDGEGKLVDVLKMGRKG